MSSNHLPAELSAAIARAKSERAANTFSPLAPFLPEPGAELHPKQAAQLAEALQAARAWERELLRHANGVLYYLDWSYADLCDESRRIPERLRALASVDGRHDCTPDNFIRLAQRVFGITVPGKTLHAQLARVLDARFWRRTLWKRIGQEKELLHLKLGLIGKNGRAYCSADAVKVRRTQRQAQAHWLKNTMLSAEIDGEQVELPMEAVAKTPHQKLSRLYAFIAAMDRMAVEAELEVALVTATLEGPWHPNPGYAKPDHVWNGKTPEEAARELSARWQRVRNDLDKKGIAVSGLWTAEPHRDGCPHRHYWLIYAPEHRHAVFAAFLGHFPGRLKQRDDDGAASDRMFETKADALAGVSRPLKRKREGAQVDVSIINRDKGSGASYVIKYVAKAIGAEGAFDGEDAQAQSQREQRTLQANPHADALTFLDDRTRTRRDHEKYLGLIDTIALLHQHQRPIKTATAHGRTVEYIEATLDDIEQANALAHEVLGRSLDELPPQTRKLLAELVRWVAERAKALGLPRTEVRFSRRELREALAWGDTQMKVHLARLVELELVSPYRLPGLPSGAMVYELRYDGDGGALPHLSGLIDVQALRGDGGAEDAYDGRRSGVNGAWSAHGRALVGAQSAPGRAASSADSQGPVRPGAEKTADQLAARVGSTPERRSHVPLAAA